MVDVTPEATFQVTHDTEPSETLIAGFASYGLAGLTAASFVVDELELVETGHVTSEQLPAFAPFENGTPRHHSRLFSREDLDITVLVNDLFIPVWAANSFASEILAWTDENGVEEVTVLSGVPFVHRPGEHDVFYVATTDYQEHRLQDSGLDPVARGYLDGVNASLMNRGIDSTLRTGLLVTPVHERAPDVEASIRLVDTVAGLYDVEIDSEPLQAFAREVEEYYRDLVQRLEAVEEQHQPDDRMYM